MTFIAERDGEWVGLATGLGDDPDGGVGPLLVGMFVAPEARRAHVATALVQAVVGWALSRGDRGLRLWVTATNHPAITLYKRCRFKGTGRSRPVAHTPSLAEIEMSRALNRG